MNETTKAIVELLCKGKPELQVAAAQVLGELRPKDAAAIEALGDGPDRSPVLGRFCLDALAKIGSAAALRKLAEAVVEHEVLSDHAAQLLGEMGAPAHGVLAAAYPQAIGEQRARILGVLARELGPGGLPVFASALLTPELSDTAASLLEGARDQFTPAVGKALRDEISGRLGDDLAPQALAKVISVLATVDAAGSKAIFLKYIDPEVPHVARAAAFRALRGVKLTALQIKQMMASLEDKAQREVHDAIRDVLIQVPELPSGLAPALKRMLTSRQPDQRLFAARMLRTSGGAELAKMFLKLLAHDDERFRQAASEALSNNKQAVEPLLKLMQTTKDAQLANVCAGILSTLSEHMPPKLQKASVEKAVKQLGSNVGLGDMLLDLALHAGGAKLVPFIVDKAVKMRRARKPAEALHVLARVAANGHGDDETHYQIALTKLLAAADAAEAEGAPGNSTMGFFAVLIRNDFPLADRLKRESAVKPEMLLRVASHFASAVGAERRFGAELLLHLAERTKGRAGDEARIALRSAGLA
ncbi:MAG: HEAT repeat domain-containing protein [Planctomycetota bacterium]|nr:HEAT repeat domain-containing protein [Planctomycetota bacterium]